MASKDDEMEALLRASLFALNAVRRHTLSHPNYTDTYKLADAIEQFFIIRDRQSWRLQRGVKP